MGKITPITDFDVAASMREHPGFNLRILGAGNKIKLPESFLIQHPKDVVTVVDIDTNILWVFPKDHTFFNAVVFPDALPYDSPDYNFSEFFFATTHQREVYGDGRLKISDNDIELSKLDLFQQDGETWIRIIEGEDYLKIVPGHYIGPRLSACSRVSRIDRFLRAIEKREIAEEALELVH